MIGIKILAIEKTITGCNVSKNYMYYLKAEARRVWELYQTDVFREMYFDKTNHNAVIILECNDRKEAEKYLATLPLVKEGLIFFEVIELEPYSGYSRLFGGNWDNDK